MICKSLMEVTQRELQEARSVTWCLSPAHLAEQTRGMQWRDSMRILEQGGHIMHNHPVSVGECNDACYLGTIGPEPTPLLVQVGDVLVKAELPKA